MASLKWDSWFNHHRLFDPIGHVPPAEFEDAHYHQFTESAASA
jgi:transposase InsO family protein